MKRALYYTLLFLVYQAVSSLAVSKLFPILFQSSAAEGPMTALIVSDLIASLLTIFTFVYAKWCPVGLSFVKTRPYGIIVLSVVVALSSLFPSAWFEEQLPDAMTTDLLQDVFEALMRSPMGYVAVGLLAPLTEELVFRGAILRALLLWLGDKRLSQSTATWTAIAVSALLFAIVHLNPAQMPHAFLLGLLLGWIYCRTHSILPGIIFHWINNSMAFLFTALYPELPYNAKLVDYFAGNQMNADIAVAVSFLILIAVICCLNKLTRNIASNLSTSSPS